MSGGSRAWETRRARYGESGATDAGLEGQRRGIKKMLAASQDKALRTSAATKHAARAKASLPTVNFKGPDDDEV